MSRRSSNLLGQAEDSLITVNNLLAHCHFREALRAAMSLAQEANRYLDEISPWNKLKEDPEGVEHCLHTAVVVLSFLKTMLYPFLPFSSHKLHFLLGLPGNLDEAGWTPQVPQPGQKLPFPTPLFAKLDDHLVEEEVGRLGQASDVPSILSE